MQGLRKWGAVIIINGVLATQAIAAPANTRHCEVLQNFLVKLKHVLSEEREQRNSDWVAANYQSRDQLQFRQDFGTLMQRGQFSVGVGAQGLEITQRF